MSSPISPSSASWLAFLALLLAAPIRLDPSAHGRHGRGPVDALGKRAADGAASRGCACSGARRGVIKHGIRMSAMPAWGTTPEDPDIRELVAFLERMPAVTAEDYQRMTR